MKVIFDHPSPFSLAHGGFQVQIEESKAGLERLGVEVEMMRWWDGRQRADLIHYFGPPPLGYLEMAREKDIPVVATVLFTTTCNRPPFRLALQGVVTRALLTLPGWGTIKRQLQWESFRRTQQQIVGLEVERHVLRTVYDVPENHITVVPLGLNDAFLKAGKPGRSEPHLITTSVITSRKRCVELALMAREAQVPILFVGKPYHEDDAYWKKFSALIDDRYVLYQPHVESRTAMIELLQASRGFVIYSEYENWCLSAHEAAACGLPVLLPDLPWSRECFGAEASYLHAASSRGNPALLRAFYDRCASQGAPRIRLYSWDDVAAQIKACYESMLGSR